MGNPSGTATTMTVTAIMILLRKKERAYAQSKGKNPPLAAYMMMLPMSTKAAML